MIILQMKKKIIPPNLLSAPVTIDIQRKMNDDELKLYNI